MYSLLPINLVVLLNILKWIIFYLQIFKYFPDKSVYKFNHLYCFKYPFKLNKELISKSIKLYTIFRRWSSCNVHDNFDGNRHLDSGRHLQHSCHFGFQHSSKFAYHSISALHHSMWLETNLHYVMSFKTTFIRFPIAVLLIYLRSTFASTVTSRSASAIRFARNGERNMRRVSLCSGSLCTTLCRCVSLAFSTCSFFIIWCIRRMCQVKCRAPFDRWAAIIRLAEIIMIIIGIYGIALDIYILIWLIYSITSQISLVYFNIRLHTENITKYQK